MIEPSAGKPWQADRPLDLESARAAIAAQHPGLDVEGLRWLGSGWEFDVYATGCGWVVRFPRRREYAELLQRDEVVLPLVAPAMAPLAVPEVGLRGEPGPHFPYRFAGHRLLPGVGADTAGAALAPGFARDLGRALGRLHALDQRRLRAAGVDDEPEDAADWLAEARREAPGLRGRWAAVDEALDWLEGVATPPLPYPGPPRLVHNDLCPDHVIVEPRTGALVGFIDWTDVAFGDPALDFVVLWAWKGRGFIDRVLHAYPPALRDSAFERRLGFTVRVRTLHWLHSALEQDGDSRKHLAWVRNAFA